MLLIFFLNSFRKLHTYIQYKCPQLRKNHDSTLTYTNALVYKCMKWTNVPTKIFYFYLFSFNGDSVRRFFYIQIFFFFFFFIYYFSHVFYCELWQRRTKEKKIKTKSLDNMNKIYRHHHPHSNCYRSTWRIHIMMMGWMVCGGDYILYCY